MTADKLYENYHSNIFELVSTTFGVNPFMDVLQYASLAGFIRDSDYSIDEIIDKHFSRNPNKQDMISAIKKFVRDGDNNHLRHSFINIDLSEYFEGKDIQFSFYDVFTFYPEIMELHEDIQNIIYYPHPHVIDKNRFPEHYVKYKKIKGNVYSRMFRSFSPEDIYHNPGEPNVFINLKFIYELFNKLNVSDGLWDYLKNNKKQIGNISKADINKLNTSHGSEISILNVSKENIPYIQFTVDRISYLSLMDFLSMNGVYVTYRDLKNMDITKLSDENKSILEPELLYFDKRKKDNKKVVSGFTEVMYEQIENTQDYLKKGIKKDDVIYQLPVSISTKALITVYPHGMNNFMNVTDNFLTNWETANIVSKVKNYYDNKEMIDEGYEGYDE